MGRISRLLVAVSFCFSLYSAGCTPTRTQVVTQPVTKSVPEERESKPSAPLPPQKHETKPLPRPAENETKEKEQAHPPEKEEKSCEIYPVHAPVTLTNQELLDSALEYCQASNDFWERGDLDNALDALDKAYSLILKVNTDDDPEALQQKEDLRFTISKRIIEVYSSRFTVANGLHKAIPLVMNKHVKRAINSFKGREKKFFLDAYRRSGRYRPAIVKALREAGLPEELSWLPLIESGFKVRAMSRARALGIWQFIASTGYKYGLKRNSWIDERMDPEKSTQAAIAYLKELHQIFGDWTTVLAAYNCGEGTVLKKIRSQRINYLDHFWDLYEKLPRETASYVPRFMAVLHILNNPAAYGFNLPPLDQPIETEKVTIDKQVHLRTIAKRLGINYRLLKELNAELRRELTPNSAYELKVPKGKGDVLLAELQDIPAWRPPQPRYLIHRVRSGDTLSGIAKRYGSSVRSIMAANGLKSRSYLKVGWRLKIPTGKGGYISSRKGTRAYILKPGERLVKYKVRRGDSLWTIARRYNTTTRAIQSINQLRGTRLKTGQILLIPKPTPAGPPPSTRQYTVRPGDSPYLIARRYGMDLAAFLKLNNLTPRSTIFPGQVLRIRE
ncbi:MAG: LysM peptidoglycan-binding domain-containing protein [Deltaproteobacteria bacterium]|nr:LysM peptidoglycan-binding domain-containing protein [Deltaproteobacteria bacterium]MBW2017394.1 LysM peptidoglycan-binding domain-containing protein [Deltaproteobacteria bacterium]MBW2129437.1 LysM peptidoglycan-binding domain-containing protein [Deltaproteobacteria bacterium]MBW2302976.1 LysM peptidoglycan-binding domain-containing protein [Deltaproteobacteria bacterium]